MKLLLFCMLLFPILTYQNKTCHNCINQELKVKQLCYLPEIYIKNACYPEAKIKSTICYQEVNITSICYQEIKNKLTYGFWENLPSPVGY